jgi:hypothetical protein
MAKFITDRGCADKGNVRDQFGSHRRACSWQQEQAPRWSDIYTARNGLTKFISDESNYLHPSLFREGVGSQGEAGELESSPCVASYNGSNSMGSLASITSWPSLAYVPTSGPVFDTQAKVSVDTSPISSFLEHPQWSCFQEVAESTSRVDDPDQSVDNYLALLGA